MSVAARQHLICDKTYFRSYQVQSETDHQILKKKGKDAASHGRLRLVTVEEAKRQLEKGALPSERLDLIDKVVRMRLCHGRFGIDFSESVNFTIDQS